MSVLAGQFHYAHKCRECQEILLHELPLEEMEIERCVYCACYDLIDMGRVLDVDGKTLWMQISGERK